MEPGRTDVMLRSTTVAMVVTDIGFIAYWLLIVTNALPAEAMFEEYTDPRVAAWNWSFLPLDIAASLTGLAGAHALRRGSVTAIPRIGVSLALTATAGGLAVVYFAQRGQFDPAWLIPNLALLLFPLPLLLRLGRSGMLTRGG